jgi:hypothetical protein
MNKTFLPWDVEQRGAATAEYMALFRPLTLRILWHRPGARSAAICCTTRLPQDGEPTRTARVSRARGWTGREPGRSRDRVVDSAVGVSPDIR